VARQRSENWVEEADASFVSKHTSTPPLVRGDAFLVEMAAVMPASIERI